MNNFSDKVKKVLEACEWIPELETNCNYFVEKKRKWDLD